ncbi:PAS domain S-box protein [Roseomonas sp. SSH11]|uniref:histidine kinase n=1 Tax=Pararoseomonas baculiformis TaxID=2820812 RepID=A0ABS4AB88_9PROT|nr:HWE histidine kinase domain-containing protein [Pararoseomonas baculiformis]MBP0444275.1 PAS domain S-box protein [Pararoseomonas baculiformis]
MPQTAALEKMGAARPEAPGLRGLRSHLLALVLAVLAPALLISGGAAWHLAGSYRHAFETRLQDTTRALALFVDSEIDTQLTTVTALASSPLLQRGELEVFREWARGIAEGSEGWVVVNDAAPGHQQLLNTALPADAPLPPPSAPGQGAWDIVREVVETRRPAMSNLFTGQATGRHVVVAAAPVMRDGQVTQVVVLVMDPAVLSRRLRQRRPSSDAFVSVADGNGRIVARSQDHDRFVGMIPPSRMVDPAERSKRLFRAMTVYGEPGLFSAQDLQMGPGWSVVVSVPYAQYRLSWLAPLGALLVGSAVALGIGLGVAAWLARRMLHPVEALVRRADAVVAGSSAPLPPVPPAGVAEFEALRRSSERAEATLAAREAEFRAIFETAAAGVAETEAATGRYLRVNDTFCAITGRPAAELVGRLGPRDLLHPADRALSAPSAGQLGGMDTESRLLRPDGEVVWVQSSTAVSMRGAAGQPLRMVTVAQDITARKRAEEARRLLSLEVDHRAKNVLAVVQAVLRLTPRDDPATYASAVEARIAALARAHTLLAQASWRGAELRALAEAELGAFQAGGSSASDGAPRARLSGPHVMLTPGAAQALSMVLHELATNAVKYGALSAPGGLVDLSWSTDHAAGLLRLCWAESGGPPVSGPPSRQGFGSRVIKASLRDQLGGQARPVWHPTGLVCEIEAPIDRALLPGGPGMAG